MEYLLLVCVANTKISMKQKNSYCLEANPFLIVDDTNIILRHCLFSSEAKHKKSFGCGLHCYEILIDVHRVNFLQRTFLFYKVLTFLIK